jgi:hypothetical protein
VGKKREMEHMEIDEEEMITKKTNVVVSLTTKHWRGYQNSPARSNEGCGSQLPGFGTSR